MITAKEAQELALIVKTTENNVRKIHNIIIEEMNNDTTGNQEIFLTLLIAGLQKLQRKIYG